MPAVSRRDALIAGASFVCAPAVFAQERSEKVAFMKAAIKWIEENVLPPQYPALEIPRIGVFGDWDFYYILSQLRWTPNPGDKFREVIVPKGFVTDLASIPRAFWSIVPKTGRYAYAAIVHDYLYWTQSVSRDDADSILEIAMKDARVETSTLNTITAAVRLLGQSAWDGNKKLKAAGEKRVLKTFPDDPLISWEVWGKRPDVFAD